MSTPGLLPHAGGAVTGLTVRQVFRGAMAVAVVSAGVSALVAGTYRATVGDGLDVASLQALAANPAIRTLFGEPAALDTAGGFTVWRTGTVVAVLVAVWGSLAATRLTRGEDDAGRWDLLLAGRLPVAAVIARQLGVLVAAMVLTGALVTTALFAAGTAATGALLHGAGIAALGVFFVGAGGFAAQLWPGRSPATAAAITLLGVSLLARMIGDGVPALSWLRWLSPFGLMELSRPYAGDRWVPVLILTVAALAAVMAASAASRRRDLRGGWFTPAAGRTPRLALLGSVPGFAVRRLVPSLAGWALGIGGYFLLIGMVARSMTGFLTDNPPFADAAARVGFAELGSVNGYTATLFTLLAVPVGVFTAIRIAAFVDDETTGRLTLLHAQPVTRAALAGSEAAATVGGAALLAVIAAGTVWIGTTAVDAGLALPDALAGTANALPVAMLSLGAAVLALGVAPRLVALIGSLPTAGGFLWYVIADSVNAPSWARQVSPFAHVAAVPAEPPDWSGTAGILAVAALATAGGLWAYQRRDLRTS